MNQNSKFKIQNSRGGFTLVEIMVVLAIIGILTAAAILNFGKNADRDVRQESDRLTSFLREVQNKSLAGDRAGLTVPDGKVVCGYGVSPGVASVINAYYIVANMGDDCSSGSISKLYDSNHQLSAFQLAKNVKISGSFSDIFFLSPNGKVYTSGSPLSGSVNISLIKDSATSNTSVDASGRIY